MQILLNHLDTILAAGIVAVFTGATVLKALSWKPSVVVGLFTALGTIPAAGATAAALTGTSELESPAVWFSRASFAVFLVVGAVAVLKSTRGPRYSRAPGSWLGFAGLTYCSAAILTEFVAGTTPQRKTLLLALGILSVWLARDATIEDVALWAKAALIAYIAGTGIALLVAPEQAWHGSGGGVIPGLNDRLSGLSPHPNGLGPLMVLYLIVERLFPSRRLVRLPFTAAASIFLVLTQSKTAWAAAIVVLIVVWWSRSSQRGPQLLMAVASVALVGALSSAGLLEDAQPLPEDTTRLETLTGRTEIWHVGIEAWREDPLWGGGPQLYSDYADRTGQRWAGHAHNQFINTLGEQGLVGFAGLLLYLGAMAFAAWRTAAISNYWSVALFGAFAIRTITENPVHTFGLEHLIVLSLLFSWERLRWRASQSEPREPTPSATSTSRKPSHGRLLRS